MAPPSIPATPSTPAGQTPQQATPSGAWKHPQFDEIARRQYATAFDERNVRAIAMNTLLLLLSFVARSVSSKFAVLDALANPLGRLVQMLPYHSWIILAIRAFFFVNIAIAFMPLVRRCFDVDQIADIPLTPSQRASMGLKTDVLSPRTPASAYASPNYITPPRYQKSTPRSSFSNQGDYTSGSPLSGSPRASMAKSTSNSPFSPNNSTGSPMFQRAMGSGSTSKRLSYDGRGSPMNSSLFGDSSSSATPGTPTPSTGKASVGLNNKWLYEKRRDSPRSSLFS